MRYTVPGIVGTHPEFDQAFGVGPPAASAGSFSDTFRRSVSSERSVILIVNAMTTRMATESERRRALESTYWETTEKFELEATTMPAEATATSHMSRLERKEIVSAMSSRSTKNALILWRRPRMNDVPTAMPSTSHSHSVRN